MGFVNATRVIRDHPLETILFFFTYTHAHICISFLTLMGPLLNMVLQKDPKKNRIQYLSSDFLIYWQRHIKKTKLICLQSQDEVYINY